MVWASTRAVRSGGAGARSSRANRRSISSGCSAGSGKWGSRMASGLVSAGEQVAAQQRFGAMKAYPRCTFVDIQYERDLGERAVDRVAQCHHLGIRRRQGGNRVREHALQVGALGELLGQRI